MSNKSEVFGYVFFFLALAAVVAFVAGIIPESTMLVLLTLFGFSGIGALRTFIDSHGWKTFASIFLGALGLVLEWLGVFTPDKLATWLVIWGIISGGGLVHAVKKANNG